MKSILLVGLGRFGKHIASHLEQLGHQVMGVDYDEERVNNAMDVVTSAQIGDSKNEEFIRSLGVGDFDVCIVAIGNDFQSSLETTCALKESGAKLVVARAESDVQAKFLLRNGADEIVYPEKQVAKWAAIRYGSNHVLDFIELDEKHSIFEVEVPQSWIGRSIADLDIRKKYSVNVMAVKENGKTNISITPDIVLTDKMSLLVLGEHKALQKCFKI